MRVLIDQPGMFGRVKVIDSHDRRLLLIGGQVQGAAYKYPGAMVVDDRLSGVDAPGPVAESAYMAGWLLAGSQNKSASGVMLGLGSGAGVCALLYNFPDFDLTVAEIDPVVVHCALAFFPLLGHFMDQGRLQIREGDAAQLLTEAIENDEEWDVGFMDAYQGGDETHAPDELVTMMADRAKHLWVNCIDSWPGTISGRLADVLSNFGKPVQWAAGANVGDIAIKTNLIMTTQEIDAESADSFIPYPKLEGNGVEAAREDYAVLVSRANPVKPLD